MTLERPKNLEEYKGNIDLSNLSVIFCDDDLINEYSERELARIKNKDQWLEENHEIFTREKDKIAKAVQDGIISDSHPETIWQFKVKKTQEINDKLLEVKNELEEKIELIKIEVTKRLGKFLSNWTLETATVTFTINEKANYCIDGTKITVDLGRLLYVRDVLEDVIEGITHEVFHVWMGNRSEQQDSHQDDDESIDQSKSNIVFGTINEGLAVLVSGQSLEEHHKDQGRDYEKYVVESFAAFREFLMHNDHDILEDISSREFKNMGHFYVVGNEVAKAVLRQIGLDKFRDLIKICRSNPQKMLDEYRVICENNSELMPV